MEKLMYRIYIDKDKKLNLSYNGLMIQNEIYDILNEDDIQDSNNIKIINPFYELINNIDNINDILKRKDINSLEYLYLNRHKLIKILYDFDCNISIDEKMITQYTDYYYLYSLINYQSEIVNFKYNFQLVQNAYDQQITTDGIIRKIIMSKIVITIIDNFLSEEQDTDAEEKGLNLKNECIKYIDNNKKELKEYQDLDLDNLEKSDVSVEDIYADIIYTLIAKNKLNESEEILDELKIKNIRLNKTIFCSIKNAFSESNINNYEICEYNDFFNQNKINFFFILFEYILKSSDYILYIPFLVETKKKILAKVKENLKDLYHYFDVNKKKNDNSFFRLKKVLNYFIELDYFLTKAKPSPDKNVEQPQNDSKKSSISNSYNQSIASSSIANSSSYVFEQESYKNRNINDPNSYSNYEVSQKSISELKKEKAFNILYNSNFVLIVEYKEERNETFIKFKKIMYKDESDKDCEVTFEELKAIEAQDYELNNKFEDFINVLEKIQREIKSQYRRDKITEIDLNFIMEYYENYENYDITCKYYINNEEKGEKDFKDENILDDKCTFNGLTYMLNALQC